MKPHAYVFADGSSSRHEDVGAWASIVVTPTRRKVLYGVSFPSTISRCELMPIVEALRWIKANWVRGPGFRVEVYSDSEYTVKTLCGLYPRGKNKELWAALDEAAKGMSVTYNWRQRNSLDYMTFCDGICGGLRRSTIQTMEKLVPDARAMENYMPEGDLPDGTTENIPQEQDTEIRSEDEDSTYC